MRKATKLEELQIGVVSEDQIADYHSKLGKVDLSANKKLKKLWFHAVEVKTLDLRKNTKLREVKIDGDKYLYDFNKSGKKAGRIYSSADTKT